MPLMTNEEYYALLDLINKLTEKNEALKEEEREIEKRLESCQLPQKEKSTRKNSPCRPSSPQRRSASPSRPKSSRRHHRASSPREEVVCPATAENRPRRTCRSPSPRDDPVSLHWKNDSFHSPPQASCPCPPEYQDTLLARLFDFAHDQARLVSLITDTEQRIACTRNAIGAKEETCLDDAKINPSQPTVCASLTPASQHIASQGQHKTLEPIASCSEKTLSTRECDDTSSNSPANLDDQDNVAIHPTEPTAQTPELQQEQHHSSPILPSCSEKSLSTRECNANSSNSPTNVDDQDVFTIQPTEPTDQTPEQEQHSSSPILPSCSEMKLSSNGPSCSKTPSVSSKKDHVPLQPTEPTEPIALTPVSQPVTEPAPPLPTLDTNATKCKASCSTAGRSTIAERKSSIQEAVNEMSAIQQCLDNVQEVVKTHTSINDVLYLQESLSNVEVSILAAHFSLATAPPPEEEEDDNQSVVSYRTPSDIITIWMDIDATKRRLSFLMKHAQNCTMCKYTFDATFNRIDDELSSLAEELKRYHNQEPIKNSI